jgi:Na+/proline symporter
MAFPKLATHQAPGIIGGWCLVGIIAASLSTASGAILAMGTVFSHNIVRQLDSKWPNLVTAENLLVMARVMTIPFAVASACLAAFYRETGYLLIVSFDITLASIVAPLVSILEKTAFMSLITSSLKPALLPRTTTVWLFLCQKSEPSSSLPFHHYGRSYESHP